MASKNKVSLNNLFDKIKEGELKDLNLVVKADVKGTVEALTQSLLKLNDNEDVDEVQVNIIHSGTGGINESDINLASASNALVIGFNVRPNINAIELAKQEEVDVRTYRVIYDILNDVKNAISGMLTPEITEEVLGRCEVRETFKLPSNDIVAGIYVLKGKIARKAFVKVLRDDVIIHEGPISSLKRFQDDAREIAQGYEGVSWWKTSTIFKSTTYWNAISKKKLRRKFNMKDKRVHRISEEVKRAFRYHSK